MERFWGFRERLEIEVEEKEDSIKVVFMSFGRIEGRARCMGKG
jgi:hypothetical protein